MMGVLGVLGTFRRPAMGANMKKRYLLVCGAMLMASLGSPAFGQSSSIDTGCQKLGRNAASLPYIRLLDPTPTTTEASILGGGGPRGYTRLSVQYFDCAGGLRSYARESRDPVSRFFLGKNISKVLKLKAAIFPTDLNATMTLANVGRKSGDKGDIWTTEISNERQLLPYFRVDNSSSAMLEFEFVANQENVFGGASKVIDLVGRAANVIAPPMPLVTSENIERFNDAAQFVDRSISELLYVSITERLSKDTSLKLDSSDRDGTVLAEIILFAPTGNKAKSASDSMPLGRWVIIAEPLIESLFVPTSGGPGEVSATAVMNFRVAEKKTLQDAIVADEAVSTARDELLKAKGAPSIGDAADKLCAAVRLRADGVGLAPVDVKYAGWAYSVQQSPGGNAANALTAACARS